jgi:hypothetical protein
LAVILVRRINCEDFAGFPKCPVTGKFFQTDKYGHSPLGATVFETIFGGLLLPLMV